MERTLHLKRRAFDDIELLFENKLEDDVGVPGGNSTFVIACEPL